MKNIYESDNLNDILGKHNLFEPIKNSSFYQVNVFTGNMNIFEYTFKHIDLFQARKAAAVKFSELTRASNSDLFELKKEYFIELKWVYEKNGKTATNVLFSTIYETQAAFSLFYGRMVYWDHYSGMIQRLCDEYDYYVENKIPFNGTLIQIIQPFINSGYPFYSTSDILILPSSYELINGLKQPTQQTLFDYDYIISADPYTMLKLKTDD